MKALIICLLLFIISGCVKKDVPTTGAIHGVVRESETGQPLSGCSVMLMPTGMTATTGGDGSFQFEDLLPDTYSVEVSCYGYYTNKKSIIVGVSESSMSVDILLTKYDPNNRLAELGAMKVSEVTFRSARVECEIIEQGSSSVTERGFIYSETPDVTVATATKQIVKTTEDIFSATLNNLAEKTDYYVAAYAINGRGTAYSEVMKFTTGDASSVTAPTNVIYVSVSGNNANDGLSWSKAKKTIKAAIDLATKDNQIWVSIGSFQEIVTPKDGVPIYGGFEGNESTTETRTKQTTIKALKCEAYSEKTVFNGFEIKSNSSSDNSYLKDNAALENCRITGMTLQISGSTEIQIKDCIIESGRSDSYGGTISILSESCSLKMVNSFFRGNRGKVVSFGSLDMYNCVLSNNDGCIRMYGEKANLYNCTIANNNNVIDINEGKVNFYNCLVWNCPFNEQGVSQFYSLIVKTADNNNVKFKKPSSGKGYEAADWQTADWSIQAGSSCIDAGNTISFPTSEFPTDIAGEPRVIGNSIDIGAYEY